VNVTIFLILLIFLTTTDKWHADDADETDQRRFLRICANPSNLRHLRTIIAVLSGLVITAFCLYHQYPVYKAYKQWNANLFKPVGFDKNQSKEGRLIFVPEKHPPKKEDRIKTSKNCVYHLTPASLMYIPIRKKIAPFLLFSAQLFYN
jgi:hypothetical protein